MDKDIELNEDAIEDFLTAFSEESLEAEQPTETIEVLEMPLDKIEDTVEEDGFLNEMFGKTLRGYTRLILLDLTKDVFESMEQRKQRV